MANDRTNINQGFLSIQQGDPHMSVKQLNQS